MSHLQSSAANLPGYEEIDHVGIGAPVTYHIQEGRQRQGRSDFPAFVLFQHPDDGTVDLHVFFEPEDQIWLRRVPAWTKEQPGNSWSPIQDNPANDGLEELGATLRQLVEKVFGSYNDPPKAIMEHLADFDERLSALERSLSTAEKAPRKDK